ncbi:tRNA (guanine(26)-N(2))-dimethyltransferase [Aplysia californica]|uniref:tRNA (guanine(26)-N(2))-dimethyltransferase n=1 Tax=Aplysia californica TaxID=6500 RepID=A0ABM0JNY1_APLCA|nr:tRNA (guanine(26)-N(2))-dimethyltransferase [Aplysia californica]
MFTRHAELLFKSVWRISVTSVSESHTTTHKFHHNFSKRSCIKCTSARSVAFCIFPNFVRRQYCSLPIGRPRRFPMSAEVNEVTEGLAKVVLPKSVFYNPVQEYNRDLTIAVISEYAKLHFANAHKSENGKRSNKKSENSETKVEKSDSGLDPHVFDNDILEPGKYYENGIKIFEGLAASGLRSVRFGLEIPGVKEVIANDFDKTAVEFIERNISQNDLGHIMKSRHGDAAMGMYERKSVEERFDVIDLDPYGSPHLFLDAAVQAVKDGGLLCITCTDAAVLCGNAPEKCSANYGALSLRSKFCHEMGVRIILQCLDSHANRYSRYIVPLISLSIDFYFRVFVRVYTGQKQVKHSATKKAMVYECVGCGSHALQPLAEAVPTKGEGNFKFMPGTGPVVGPVCSHCGHHHRVGGPIWSAPIHDKDFVKQVIQQVQTNPKPLGTKDRICGMLSLVLEELPDIPLYYVLDAVCSVLHCTLPKMTILRSAFLNAGYRVSLSHAAKNSYKTDAPAQFVWDVMREWVKENPVTQKRMEDGSVTKSILEKAQVSQVSFEEHPEANPQSREIGLLRWQTNPEPNWGPKARAKRTCDDDASSAKQKKSKSANVEVAQSTAQ